jgi:hypothetical protein
MSKGASIVLDMPMAKYRAADAYGASDLKAMRAGPPAMVPWRRANPSKETDATRLGTAAHCAIIEPLSFEKRYAHKPDGMSFATKEGKAWKASVPDGIAILSHDESTQVAQIVAAARGNPRVRGALDAATAKEASLFWNDPDTGLPLKARPDWFIQGDYVYDLKVTRHAGNPGALAFRAYVEGWFHQLSHYEAGLIECGVKVKGARIVAIHPEPPQDARVYTLEIKEDALSLMHLDNERTIKRIAECHERDCWPGSPEEWTKIDVPALALNEAAQVQWEEEQDDVLGRTTNG